MESNPALQAPTFGNRRPTMLNQNHSSRLQSMYRNPWTFKFEQGLMVEDSDIGPKNDILSIFKYGHFFQEVFGDASRRIPNIVIVASILLQIYYKKDIPQETHCLFIVLLSLSLLTHFIAELIIFLKARRQESVWRYFSFLKYNFQKKKFSLAGIPTLKIGDLVLIISGNIAPVDLLLLDCGVMKYGENTCRVNEDRIYGRPNIVNKRSIRKFDEETSEQDRVKSYEHIPKLVEQLTGQIEYGPPIEGVMHIKGSFKLRNDPRISPMNYNNILFSGSKLATNWAFGMVLFNGKTSSIIRKNRLAQCIKRGHAKKYGSFFGLSNRINAVFVVLSFIFGFAFLSYYSLSKKNMVFFFFSNQSKSNRTGCQSICSFL